MPHRSIIVLLFLTLSLLTVPQTQAAKVKIDDDPTLGSPEAPLVMMEFSSFQCGYCGLAARDVLPRLKKDYVEEGKLEIVYLDVPLQIHPQSGGAAVAAVCADDQGKFWPYHDFLFSNQTRLSDELFTSLAERLELDMDAFAACREDKKTKARVEQDLREAGFAKVRSTPTFVFGRRIDGGDKVKVVDMIRGAPPYEEFQAKIEELLAAP